MSERLSPDRRPSDDDLIKAEIDSAIELEATISPAAARVIASQIDAGPTSAVHSFVTTGAVSPELIYEIEVNFQMAHQDEDLRRKIAFLSLYVMERHTSGDHKPVEGWARIWLEATPEDQDLCPCCSEHISSNHRVGCPLGEDDEPTLDRIIQLGQEHGEGILHYLSFRGYRSLEEIDQVVREFESGYYLGHFEDLDAFKREYEIGPDVLVEQDYYIAESLDGTLHLFQR
ncbi:hypothetical protein [Mycolicibacterium sp. PDY-3]|uniref:hypothetical protein n=1 Tax=Mycolicibacterium sp. PDY-3 TaxID=3376069 RepID=UPI003796841F